MEMNFRLYDELSREERLAIKSRLADLAVGIVTTHPDGIQEQSVLQELRADTQGQAAGFGIQLAVEQQRLERDFHFEDSSVILRLPQPSRHQKE